MYYYKITVNTIVIARNLAHSLGADILERIKRNSKFMIFIHIAIFC